MNVNLSIKGVPNEIAQRLRERAARNHRSLQRELMVIIEEAALHPSPQAGSDATAKAVLHEHAAHARPETTAHARGTKTIDEVVAEIRRRHPQAVGGAPLAVDIVRESRDGR